jgi:hypothetical protein
MLLGSCTSRTPNAECAARQDVQGSQRLGRRCTMRVEHRLGGLCKFGANRERAVQDVVLHAYALTKIGV